jgi:hypothetical protein
MACFPLLQVDLWLKKKNLPRLSLPVICGYIPLVNYLAKGLKDNKAAVELA